MLHAGAAEKLFEKNYFDAYTRVPNDHSIISQYAGLCQVEINDNYQLISSQWKRNSSTKLSKIWCQT